MFINVETFSFGFYISLWAFLANFIDFAAPKYYVQIYFVYAYLRTQYLELFNITYLPCLVISYFPPRKH